ncbi:MAG: flagellin, partial [Methanoregula sp.]
YVVLGAGFFTSQTAQATVHTGVQQASSSMELVGNVYGVQGTTNLQYVNVTIALTAGGTPMDISSMVVSYTDNNQGHNANVLPSNPDDLLDCGTIIGTDATQDNIKWCIGQKINNVTTGSMLDNNAQMILVVGMPSDTASPNTKFTINLQPAVGAVLPISRTIPGGLTHVQPLY